MKQAADDSLPPVSQAHFFTSTFYRLAPVAIVLSSASQTLGKNFVFHHLRNQVNIVFAVILLFRGLDEFRFVNLDVCFNFFGFHRKSGGWRFDPESVRH